MTKDWQHSIESYLNLLSDYVVVQVIVVLASAWLVAIVADSLFLSWFKKVVVKVDKDNPLVGTRHSALYFSILLLGVGISTTLLDLPAKAHLVTISLISTLTIIVWARFLLRVTRFVLRSLAANPNKVNILNSKTLPLFENTAFIFLIVITVYYVFITWGVDMTAWLASAGIVGIAVGFAAKDTLANLFSGLFIMADAPYEIGDMVVLDGGERGEITKIGIRSTRMLTRDDVEVTIPNAVMGNTKILNESGGHHPKSRICVQVGVAYGCDIDKVRELLVSIGNAESTTCHDPEPRVRFRTFGASGLDFELLCWIENPAHRGRILDSLNSAVYKAFQKEGIEIPYAKQDIYIKEMPGRAPVNES
jgi:MscS family membrane protein